MESAWQAVFNEIHICKLFFLFFLFVFFSGLYFHSNPLQFTLNRHANLDVRRKNIKRELKIDCVSFLQGKVHSSAEPRFCIYACPLLLTVTHSSSF